MTWLPWFAVVPEIYNVNNVTHVGQNKLYLLGCQSHGLRSQLMWCCFASIFTKFWFLKSSEVLSQGFRLDMFIFRKFQLVMVVPSYSPHGAEKFPHCQDKQVPHLKMLHPNPTKVHWVLQQPVPGRVWCSYLSWDTVIYARPLLSLFDSSGDAKT